MKHTISKEFRFEAAHRLTAPYRGNCSHLHGHSFVVRVTLAANELDERGFVEDFSALKPLKAWIDANLDHATLVGERDHELIAFLRASDQKHFILPVNPTSEILSRTIYEQAQAMGFRPHAVEIMETCTSSTRYQPL